MGEGRRGIDQSVAATATIDSDGASMRFNAAAGRKATVLEAGMTRAAPRPWVHPGGNLHVKP